MNLENAKMNLQLNLISSWKYRVNFENCNSDINQLIFDKGHLNFEDWISRRLRLNIDKTVWIFHSISTKLNISKIRKLRKLHPNSDNFSLVKRHRKFLKMDLEMNLGRSKNSTRSTNSKNLIEIWRQISNLVIWLGHLTKVIWSSSGVKFCEKRILKSG